MNDRGVGTWAEALVADFCFDFAPTPLELEWIADRAAADWYDKKVGADPHFFGSHVATPPVQRRTQCVELMDETEPCKDGSRSRKRLRLMGDEDAYRPLLKGVPSNFGFCEGIEAETRGKSTHHLCVKGKAAGKLLEHIEWGKRTDSNRVEQGGLLLGHVFEDRERGLIYGVAEDAAPARLARGSSSHLALPAEAWREMLDAADGGDADEPQQVIGWYHTHPENLSVFMSGTDRTTQRQLFFEDWHFAMVLNPQRKEFRVYHGADSKECRGNIDPEHRCYKHTDSNPSDRARLATENADSISLTTRCRSGQWITPVVRNRFKKPYWPVTLGFVLGLAVSVGIWNFWPRDDARMGGSNVESGAEDEVVPHSLGQARLKSHLEFTTLAMAEGIEIRVPRGLMMEVIGEKSGSAVPVRLEMQGLVEAEDVERTGAGVLSDD